MDNNSIAHTRWNCKYHIVFTPKYRRQIIYKQISADIGQIIRTLCARKGIEIIEAAALPDHMLNNPQILILDEPTAGLDPNERIRFRNLISELSQDRLVLLSTHIVSDVEYIASRILLMKDGKITSSGTSAELIDSMREKVWICQVPKNAVEKFMRAYKVANVKTLPDGAELRIVSANRPAENAAEEAPTLEDVFLSYFGEKGGSDHGSL